MSEDTTHEGHDEWSDRLSEHLDGLLSGAQERAVEEHLDACPTCRAVLAELRAVRDAARSLEDVPPGRDLWPGIRRAVAAGSRTPSTPPAPPAPPAHPAGSLRPEGPRRTARGRGLLVTVPQLAAAAVAFLLLGGAGAWSLGLVDGPAGRTPGAAVATSADTPGSPPDAVRPAAVDEIASSYAAEVRRLERLLASSRDRLEPKTIRVLEKNLELIDRAIRESVAALEVDPGNPWVRDHLRRSWERKVTYLRETADLLRWSEAD